MRNVARRGEKFLRVGMSHAANEAFRLRSFNDPRVLHHGDEIGHAGDHRQIVSNQHQRHSLIPNQRFEEAQDLNLRRDVQCGRRLVRDQQFGSKRDSEGDAHALPLPSRQLVRVKVQRKAAFRHPDPVQFFASDFARIGRVHLSMHQKRFGDLVPDGLDRIERAHGLLENHADLAAANGAHFPFAQIEQIPSVKLRRAGAHRALRKKAHDRKRRHRFAGTGFADDAEDRSGFNIQRDVFQDGHVSDRHI